MYKSSRCIGCIITCLFLLVSNNISAQSSPITRQEIIEVYGDVIKDLNQEQVAWLYNQLERSEVIKLARQENEGFPLLSSLPLVTKYISNLQKDNFAEPLKINPLKYRINFMNKKDQTFRIDGTDYVLFVKGKK